MTASIVARWKPIAAALLIATALAGALIATAVLTRPTRESVQAYTALIHAANRQDVDGARRLCSRRYRRSHVLRPASEGGIVGLPRNIHKNFQAWRQGENVWVCPTNRVGPVYQFIHESGTWRFDGPVGLLRGHGEFLPIPDLTDETTSDISESRPENPPELP